MENYWKSWQWRSYVRLGLGLKPFGP